MGGVVFPRFDDDGNLIKQNTAGSDIKEGQSSSESKDSSSDCKEVQSSSGDKQNHACNDSDSGEEDGKKATSVQYFLNNKDKTVAQRRAFFQRQGEFLYQDLFKLVRDQKKSGKITALLHI